MKFYEDVTLRGFKLIQFYDAYDELCDIQESSSVQPHIWLGTHNGTVKILASSINPSDTGWVEYKLPEGSLVNHRMHLSKKQSIAIGIKLIMFGLFGRLSE